jgi:hypothetical protein
MEFAVKKLNCARSHRRRARQCDAVYRALHILA